MSVLRMVCEDCGAVYFSPQAHWEECPGPRPPIQDVARKIADGGAHTDADAARVAREYLAVTGLGRKPPPPDDASLLRGHP